MTPLGRTLEYVARTLTGLDWCIIGGSAAILHGADELLADIDVLAANPPALRAALARGNIPLTPDGGTSRFRSAVFARYTGLPVPVDFLAGFEVNANGGWHPVAMPSIVHLGPAATPVAALPDLIAMHRRFGRPKDRARLARLEALTT